MAADQDTVFRRLDDVTGRPELVDDERVATCVARGRHHDEAIGRDVLAPGVVPKLSGTPGAVRWAGPPAPGHDTAEVYGELGLTVEDLARLREEGVV